MRFTLSTSKISFQEECELNGEKTIKGKKNSNNNKIWRDQGSKLKWNSTKYVLHTPNQVPIFA